MARNDVELELAERVRKALIEAALAAYTDAGVRGLCCEGAWEVALAALKQLDLATSLPGARLRD